MEHPQDWIAVRTNEQVCPFVYRAFTIQTGSAQFCLEASTTRGNCDSPNFPLTGVEPTDCAHKYVPSFAQWHAQFSEVDPHLWGISDSRNYPLFGVDPMTVQASTYPVLCKGLANFQKWIHTSCVCTPSTLPHTNPHFIFCLWMKNPLTQNKANTIFPRILTCPVQTNKSTIQLLRSCCVLM